MSYMMIETFCGGQPGAVGARFKSKGRLMPEGSGAIYVASWMAADGGNCYQLVEAPDRAALDGWIANWSDLVDFVVIEVKRSAEFWAGR